MQPIPMFTTMTHPIAGYQAVNARMTHPIAGYQAVNARMTHPIAGYQAVNARMTHPIAGYQAVSARMTHPIAGYQAVSARGIYSKAVLTVTKSTYSASLIRERSAGSCRWVWLTRHGKGTQHSTWDLLHVCSISTQEVSQTRKMIERLRLTTQHTTPPNPHTAHYPPPPPPPHTHTYTVQAKSENNRRHYVQCSV